MLTIVHSVPFWLHQTEAWLYNTIRFVSRHTQSVIVCERTGNLDQFGLPNIIALSDAAPVRRKYENLVRHLGLRDYNGLLVSVARSRKAHVVHSHFGSTGWQDIGAVKRIRAKHVVTFYGQELTHFPRKDPRWYDRYRDLFAHVDRVLCEGTHMAETLRVLGCPPDKVRVQHIGVPVDEIPFRPRTWDGKGALRVLIAASFREKKGIPSALEALGRIKDQIDFEVTIIGDETSEERSQGEKRRILDVIEKYGMQARIKLLGFQPYRTLFDQAYQHHLFLSPSITAEDGDTEGGAPVSIIEMAATGMPVVSTTHCDIPSVVIHQKTGYLAAEGDVEGIASGLLFVARNRGSWAEMATAARAHVEKEFNAGVEAERLAALYGEVVGYGLSRDRRGGPRTPASASRSSRRDGV